MLARLATGKNYENGRIYCCTIRNYTIGVSLSPHISMPRVTITVLENSPQPYRFDLHREIVTVGRGQDNDIVVGCGSVSGKHSEMRRVKGGYQLIDVGSTNGIKVDGIRHQTVVLHTGMTVKLGDVEFGFILNEEELAVLASETETEAKSVKSEDKDSEEKDSKAEEISEKTDSEVVEKKDVDADGPDELPDLSSPVRLNKRAEKAAKEAEKEAEKQKKAEKEEKAKKEEKAIKEEKAKKEDGADKGDRPEKRERPAKSGKGDEFSESKAVTIGSGFILFALIMVAVAFFYGANSRHKKDTGDSLLKGIVNKEDVKKDADDKTDGGNE